LVVAFGEEQGALWHGSELLHSHFSLVVVHLSLITCIPLRSSCAAAANDQLIINPLRIISRSAASVAEINNTNEISPATQHMLCCVQRPTRSAVALLLRHLISSSRENIFHKKTPRKTAGRSFLFE
jgi:hypothetical protein